MGNKSKCQEDRINKHGLNTTRFRVYFNHAMKNLIDYRPKELARQLAKLAYEADPNAAVIAIQVLETERVKQNCG